jgi:hypothetical protein
MRLERILGAWDDNDDADHIAFALLAAGTTADEPVELGNDDEKESFFTAVVDVVIATQKLKNRLEC